MVLRASSIAAILAAAAGVASGLAAARPPIQVRAVPLSPPAQVGYNTYHFDNARTGWNPHESALNTMTVASPSFGLIRKLAADGVVYAQPLYAPHVVFPDGQHNVVLLASENDSVYAYDADTGSLLWKRSFINPSAGVTAVPSSAVGGCSQIAPTIGISSTPVLDRETNTLYVSDKIQVTQGSSTTYHDQLHALDLLTGRNRVAPAEVAGSVTLSNGTVSTFVSLWHQQRPGLLLSRGRVYLGFGSSCDERGSFVHGWLFAYDAQTLALDDLFSTIGDGAPSKLASIWQGTFAPAADHFGNVYVVTGNGANDVVSGGRNFGDSVLRLSPELVVADYFTPFNEAAISVSDQDLGSSGVVVIPEQFTPGHRLAVTGGKNSTVYLMNRDALGGFTPNGPDNVYQEFATPGKMFGGPAFYPNLVYIAPGQSPLKAYTLSTSPMPHLTLASQTSNVFAGEGGPIPTISSLATTRGTAVLWATSRPGHGGTVVLYAYNATNIAKMLFSGNVGTWQADGGAFLTPTVAGGKVFVPGAGFGVAEFGLR